MKKFLIAFMVTSHAVIAQQFTSPFPTTEPLVGYSLSRAFSGLNFRPSTNRIIGGISPPGDQRLFIALKQGEIVVITNTLAPTLTSVLDLRSETWTHLEAGLMGFAFHPGFQTNGLVYTFGNVTNEGGTFSRLARWQMDPVNPNRVDPASGLIMIEQKISAAAHIGGDLKFGPDGYLYVPLGDGTDSNRATTSAEYIDRNFFGAILRIDVDGRPGNLAPNPHPSVRGGYWVPADNPWVGATSFNGKPVDPASVRTEFWAVGLRNPYRIAFEPGAASLLVADVGNMRWEEVNRVVAGGNYGWNWMEGNEITRASGVPPSLDVDAFTPPFWAYPHPGVVPEGDPNFTGNCIIGGLVYEGTKYPHLKGKYLCADFVAGHVWAVSPTSPMTVERIAGISSGPTSFALDPNTGDILISSSLGWHILSQTVDTTLPPTLSATGVFTNLNSMAPAPGIRPYEVANPFWSDYAIKSRWFYLPPDTTVTRGASDDWVFPPGMFWVKHFVLEAERSTPPTFPVETRFIVKTANGAYGLTYRWRPDLSDADLVGIEGADTHLAVQIDGQMEQQPWRFPSRYECAACHNPTAGWALGFSSRQLNLGNQLVDLSLQGVFTPTIDPSDLLHLPRLARPDDDQASLEHRFKSYADANCAYCHQPGGIGRGDWDARFSVPLADSRLIDATVVEDLGIPGARVIKPGDPTKSILYRRVADMVGPHEPAAYHMSPLASYQLDRAATNLLARYIDSLRVTTVPSTRTVWQIGTDDNPLVAPYRPYAEFSPQNHYNDLRPGQVTRLPGDPEYDPENNPIRDDDFYTAGIYPAGFNGLTAALTVPNDEPPIAWEHSQTGGDRTNRIHFVLGDDQMTADTWFRLNFEFANGGSMIDGVVQPGLADHDMVVLFRNGSDVATEIFSQRISQKTNIVIHFSAASVGASPGANTIEIIRTGPNDPETVYWIIYDYVRLELHPEVNTPPVLIPPSDLTVREQTPFSRQLSASDDDVPAQRLAYSLIAGPEGLTVSSSGLMTWTPGEAQGPGSYPVEIQVTDDGVPPLSDRKQFSIAINESGPTDPALLRSVWQIGADDQPQITPYRPYAEFSAEDGRDDPRPGQVTRLPADPQFDETTNPGADDDFYFAGIYPTGFNGLLTPLIVSNDEPARAWERALTGSDPTNRVHFHLDPVQVTPGSRLRLSFEMVNGGVAMGGFGTHDLEVGFRNGSEVITPLYSERLSRKTNVVVEFLASTVGAAAGPNTVEFVRTGPTDPEQAFWILFDYVRIEWLPAEETGPTQPPSGPGGVATTDVSDVEASP